MQRRINEMELAMYKARVIFFLLVFGLLFTTALYADNETLPPDVTIRSVAHGVGVRGGDLAEELGFIRQAPKEKSLTEMGITRTQLREALTRLGAEMPASLQVTESGEINTSMTIGQVAKKLGISGKALAHDLKLDVSVDKNVPIKSFGVGQGLLEEAAEHNLTHEDDEFSDWKYPIYTLITLFALLFLVKWGIPKNADPKKRKGYYPRWVYVCVLLVSVCVLGFLLGKSPNPMEGAVKVFKATVGLYDSVFEKTLFLGFFLVLALIANKAICGWACPFGSLQELIYMISPFKKTKAKKIPFWLTNGVRVTFFVVFLLALYGVIANKGTVIYHTLNPFNLFNLDFSYLPIVIATGVYLVASFFTYRPFCRFICPFGLLSWVVERVSLTRIRIDQTRCISCGMCENTCPLTAAGDRLLQKKLPADCFSCMRCLRNCPADAIHYRPAWGPASPVESGKATADIPE